jgi:hypothetical protein
VLELKVAVSFDPAASAPVDEFGVKVTVQRAIALTANEVALNTTPVGADAELMVTLLPGDPFPVSEVVCTVSVFAVIEPVPGFVSPSTDRVVAVLAATKQVWLGALLSVMVAVRVPPVVADAAQPLKLLPKFTVGVVGTVNPLVPNCTTTWLPAASAPPELVVKPTFHDAIAPEACDVPAKLTAVGADAEIATLAGEPGVMSVVVATEKFVPR